MCPLFDAFVLAVDGQDVAITGGGRICGSGGEWFVHEPRKKPALSPFSVAMLPTRAQAGEINTVPGTLRTFYRERIRYAEDKYGEDLPVLRRPERDGVTEAARAASAGRLKDFLLQEACA